MREAQEETILSGTRPPYVQSGMVVRHMDGGAVLRVDWIENLDRPTAACLSSLGGRVRVGCKDIRDNYVLANDFTPDMRECSICRGRHGDEVSHVCE